MTITTLVYLCFWCAMAMASIKLFVPGASNWLWVLVGSFLVSIVGDYFLRTRTSDTGFILGIAGYFVAHIGFLIYGWVFITGTARFSWVVAAIIFVPFLVFYGLALFPSQPLQNNMYLNIAVLAYLLISCTTLVVSIDVRSGLNPSWTWFYALGIACLLASDTLIAQKHFLNNSTLFELYMFPLFYTSYVFIAGSVVIKHLISLFQSI